MIPAIDIICRMLTKWRTTLEIKKQKCAFAASAFNSVGEEGLHVVEEARYRQDTEIPCICECHTFWGAI